MERKLYVVEFWMEYETASQSFDSIWVSREAAQERLITVMKASQYKNELIGTITPVEVNKPLFTEEDYEEYTIRGDELE